MGNSAHLMPNKVQTGKVRRQAMAMQTRIVSLEEQDF